MSLSGQWESKTSVRNFKIKNRPPRDYQNLGILIYINFEILKISREILLVALILKLSCWSKCEARFPRPPPRRCKKWGFRSLHCKFVKCHGLKQMIDDIWICCANVECSQSFPVVCRNSMKFIWNYFMEFGRSDVEIVIFQRSTEHQQLEQDNPL